MTTLMPATLPAHLMVCADFAAEDAITQHRLALMLWKCLEPGRQHADWPGMATFTKEEIRAIWGGSDQRMRDKLAGKHFLAYYNDYFRGRTVAYQPTQEMLDALQRCLADPRPVDLLNGDGRHVVRFPVAIDSFTGHNRKTRARAWEGVEPANAAPVSAEGLEALRPLVTPLEQQVIDVMVRMSRNTIQPGSLPHRYVQAVTGRLTAAGRSSLQSSTRRIRAAALAGDWDYDIANCHFAILAGLARRLGVAVPAIDSYLANKPLTRTMIAEEAGISIKAAKKCLLMVIYGAPLSTSPEVSMTRRIGPEAVARLQIGKTFRGIYEDIKRLRTPIIAMHTARGGWIVNAMQLRAAANKGPATLLAHIMQGYEAAALRAVVRLYGTRILLCVHDGWVTRERLSVADCEEAILREVGVPLRIEERCLEHPVVDGRLSSEYEYEGDQFFLVDQGLGRAVSFSSASNSPLRGCGLEVVHGGLDIRSLRPRCDWNYPSLK